MDEQFRSGYATIIGPPNVGKSTLMNAFLGQKISIVTHKPQTTRHRILGIHSADDHQVIFLDTPGIITPRYRLQELMMEYATSAINDGDVLLFMADALSPGIPSVKDEAPENSEAFRLLKGLEKPVFLLINKIDIVNKESLLPVIDGYSRAFPFREIFPISALKGIGTAEALSSIAKALPQHPPYYPLDILSDHQERFFVCEIIREKIFLKCQKEIPYSTTVDIVEFKEREAGKWFISADICVGRDSQKGIIIGKKGAMLKEIGRLARNEIETFLQHRIFLDLHVKVRKDWRDDNEWLRRLGYNA